MCSEFSISNSPVMLILSSIWCLIYSTLTYSHSPTHILRTKNYTTKLYSMPERESVCPNSKYVKCQKYQDVLLHLAAVYSMQANTHFWLFWPTILCTVEDKNKAERAQTFDR